MNQLLLAGIVVYALMLLALAWVRTVPLLCVLLACGGAAWTASNQNFQIAVQMSAPAWVRARAISAYQLTFQGGIALGAAIWGGVAEALGNPLALTLAAGGIALGMVAAVRWPVEDHT